jgi:Integrase core domain
VVDRSEGPNRFCRVRASTPARCWRVANVFLQMWRPASLTPARSAVCFNCRRKCPSFPPFFAFGSLDFKRSDFQMYRFHQWPANLRVLEVTEIKTVPYVPLSHPFVERLIGTLRRECLDRTLFWTTSDLEAKLLDSQHYYNEHRTHAGRKGTPPVPGVNADLSRANLSCYRWQKHCRGLYQTPIAA